MIKVTRAFVGSGFAIFIAISCGGVLETGGAVDASADARSDARDAESNKDATVDAVALDQSVPDVRIPTDGPPGPPDAGPPPDVACDGGGCPDVYQCATGDWSIAYTAGTCVNGKCVYKATPTYCPSNPYSCCSSFTQQRCGGCVIPI